ncbi:MAG: hypothetical protein E6R08_10115 [Nevskiaceae bacterium]|nr:MAG: hypothetical protein E6R08_10115 [Nevskiaceae bacterium]
MEQDPGALVVAAGVNGAGKSTAIGTSIVSDGGAYYNPDLRTRALIEAGLDEAEANARSWREGFVQLVAAIDQRQHFTFETTLGGHSVTCELLRALAVGMPVTIYYVGLNNVELHLRRVAARVARGGHDIPEQKIRERFVSSRENLLKFVGTSATLMLWDNSEEDPNGIPAPKRVLVIEDRKLILPSSVQEFQVMPDWARPIVQKALAVCAVPRKLREALQTPR